MKKLFNFLFCALFASPLAAFDISLDGVEFGTLEWEDIYIDAYNTNSGISPNFITLNEGDVVQVLDIGNKVTPASFNDEGSYCSAIFEDINNPSKNVIDGEGAIFVGPGKLKLRAFSYNSLSNGYAKLSYAILRAGASTQSSYVTIPANSSGNFEVKLQTSSDLQTWSPTTPGVFPYGDNTKFFRLIVE
jgi:hypothetical protein